jgi:hypothetical protein
MKASKPRGLKQETVTEVVELRMSVFVLHINQNGIPIVFRTVLKGSI